jgi:hypothetical protein
MMSPNTECLYMLVECQMETKLRTIQLLFLSTFSSVSLIRMCRIDGGRVKEGSLMFHGFMQSHTPKVKL